jgi:hypothetical protein
MRRALFISGDDPGAQNLVADLFESFGFAPILLGTLAQGGRIQAVGGPIAGHDFFLPWPAPAHSRLSPASREVQCDPRWHEVERSGQLPMPEFRAECADLADLALLTRKRQLPLKQLALSGCTTDVFGNKRSLLETILFPRPPVGPKPSAQMHRGVIICSSRPSA